MFPFLLIVSDRITKGGCVWNLLFTLAERSSGHPSHAPPLFCCTHFATRHTLRGTRHTLGLSSLSGAPVTLAATLRTPQNPLPLFARSRTRGLSSHAPSSTNG